MAIDPAVLRAMQAAGASIDVIIAAVEADAALDNERVETRRAKDAERQRRHRASRNVTVTECDTTDDVTFAPPSSPPNEIKSNPPPPTPTDIQTPARKAHRMPEGWEPSDLSAEVAKAVSCWPDGAVQRELERFRDWAAGGGPNTRKSDWDATWRNWLRRAADEGKYRDAKPKSKFPERESTVETGARVAARLVARRSGISGGPADVVPRLGPPGGNDPDGSGRLADGGGGRVVRLAGGYT